MGPWNQMCDICFELLVIKNNFGSKSTGYELGAKICLKPLVSDQFVTERFNVSNPFNPVCFKQPVNLTHNRA